MLAIAAAKIKATSTSVAGRGIAGVFVMKAVIIVLSFVVISLAARLLGEQEFGIYSICFSAVGLLTTVAMLGQQVLLMRSWSEYVAANDPARLKGALWFGGAALLFGIAVIGAGVLAWTILTYSLGLALSVTAYLIALTVVLTGAHVIRSAIGVGAGDGSSGILLVAAPSLYLAVCLLSGLPAQLPLIFLAFTAGALVALAIHIVMLVDTTRRLFPAFGHVIPRFETRTWTTRSVKLWLSHSLEAANQYLDVLAVGALMSPTVAGAYFVITRLANAFATAADAMNMFSTRHIPDLYFRREFKPLGHLLNSVAGVTLAITVAGLIGVLLLGGQVLAIFSPAYVGYYAPLLVLCLGTAALGAVGPSASILMFTGHEGRYLQIMVVAVAGRAAAFLLLIPHFGIMGAVAATTGSFLFMAVMLTRAAKSYTGIDGSILRLLNTKADVPLAAPAVPTR